MKQSPNAPPAPISRKGLCATLGYRRSVSLFVDDAGAWVAVFRKCGPNGRVVKTVFSLTNEAMEVFVSLYFQLRQQGEVKG